MNVPDGRPTALHALHLELGARMMNFADYALPVHYPRGILHEHLHTRARASLFDCSHMGQIMVRSGSFAAAARALETLTPADILDLAPAQQRYALLTTADGGVLDDMMVTRVGEELLLVVNAARKAEDFQHLEARLGAEHMVTLLEDRALLALQGPAAAHVLARLTPAVAFSDWPFMSARRLELDGAACLVTRSGYTGEDGFEITLAGEHAEHLARRLLEAEEVAPAGLGARDTLRLEAGLCLYGQDLSADITPVVAGLGWTIPAVRREGGARGGGFPGAHALFAEFASGAPRRRVGLTFADRLPARAGAPLSDAAGRPVGQVSSGGISPSLGAPIAMAYVEADYAVPGTLIWATVRERRLPCRVTCLPFVPHQYFRVSGASPDIHRDHST